MKHPATKLFQALRIAVNDELKSLERILSDDRLYTMLRVGGRIAIITFHSLEDRMVKRAFISRVKNMNSPHPSYVERVDESGGDGAGVGVAGPKYRYQLVTKKPVTPTEEECQMNPRSRSAKLRIIERIQ